MRQPTLVVDGDSSAKIDAVFFRSLCRIRVHDVIAPRDSLDQGASASEKVGCPLESRY
jgi:hypothetical protein